MIMTYKKGRGIKIDKNEEEYQTPRLHRTNFLNYGISVVKDKSFNLIAFFTGNSSLEPLLEGLFAQIHVNLS